MRIFCLDNLRRIRSAQKHCIKRGVLIENRARLRAIVTNNIFGANQLWHLHAIWNRNCVILNILNPFNLPLVQKSFLLLLDNLLDYILCSTFTERSLWSILILVQEDEHNTFVLLGRSLISCVCVKKHNWPAKEVLTRSRLVCCNILTTLHKISSLLHPITHGTLDVDAYHC